MSRSIVYHFAGFTADPLRRRLRDAGGRLVPLGSRAFDVLLVLLRSAGTLVERRALLHAVWKDVLVETNSLDRCISSLRRALGDADRAEPLILTDWGRGYRFTAEVMTRLGDGEPQPSEDRVASSTSSAAVARKLLLQGQALLRRGQEPCFATAVDFLRDAIDVQPDFAAAHSAYALVQVTALITGWPVTDPVDIAERHALRAVQLDPHLAEGHAVLGYVEAMRCHWGAARTRLRTATALEPGNAFLASEEPMLVAASVGHLQAAWRDLRAAHERDPANALVLLRLALVGGFLAERDAGPLLELAVTLGYPEHVYPVWFMRSCLAGRAGRPSEAANAFLKGLPADSASLFDERFLCHLYQARKDAAARAEVQPRLESLCGGDLSPFDTRVLVELIHLCGTAGMQECAFQLAAELPRRLLRVGYVEVLQALWMPELREFRQDPRFRQLADTLNLTQWWRDSSPPDAGLL